MWERREIENGPSFKWERWDQYDAEWGRRVEIRSDRLGQVTFVAHLQRRGAEGNWTPAFGWDLTLGDASGGETATDRLLTTRHFFATGEPSETLFDSGRYRLNHPAAPLKRSGTILSSNTTQPLVRYRYLRSNDHEGVPLQPYAWQRAEFVLAPAELAPPTATLCSPHQVVVDWHEWDALYGTGPPVDTQGMTLLDRALAYFREALAASVAVGCDWGNLTEFREGQAHGSVLGWNRLNHCAPIFFDAFRRGDARLLETALAWCENFYDLSMWWGPKKTGGTRYHSRQMRGEKIPDDGKSFTWRSNDAVDFCTKGFYSFLLAYEQTGDPRMLEALEAQVDYAVRHVHCDDGQCRNVGVVEDFVRLYELTGQQRYLDQAIRLFRELRTKLNPHGLFSQSGEPIERNPPFIDGDEFGYSHPFAKPYILGYALAGCPRLLRYAPDEPRLRETVESIADFMVSAQDPIGDWRYPTATSSHFSGQTLGHSWQLVQVCEALGPREKYLDTIELALKQQILLWETTGSVFNGLLGWEISTGRIAEPRETQALYKRSDDRDPLRDYTQGELRLGIAPPEALVFLPEVLRYYLKYRSVQRLLAPPAGDSPLGKVLSRARRNKLQTVGVEEDLPVFQKRLAERLTFPLAWNSQRDFESWQREARQRVRESWLAPPPLAPFDPEVIATRAAKGYTTSKIAFNLTGDSRVIAYLLAPDGPGPFPAVLLLHDHGGEFRIGKEKVVDPLEAPAERTKLARTWVDKYYGGRFLGDELAKRGYACLAVDALNWSDRGGAGFEGQQALASNLFHFGTSLAGLLAHEDQRAAEFLATRPEVDPKRVAAMGLSMGAFRTWQIAATSPHISAGVAVCWMATTKGLMSPGNNQTKGASAFNMLHPGLQRELDYPDVASLACPKPMLFYGGSRDKLFPLSSVAEAFDKLQAVWKSQKVDNRLTTKLWDAPHEFNRDMQDEAFAWLDLQLKE